MGLIDFKLAKQLIERNRLMNRPINQYLSIVVEPIKTPDGKILHRATFCDDDHAKNQWPFCILGDTKDLRAFVKSLGETADKIEEEEKAAQAKKEPPKKPVTPGSGSPKKDRALKEVSDNDHEGAPA